VTCDFAVGRADDADVDTRSTARKWKLWRSDETRLEFAVERYWSVAPTTLYI